MPGPVLGTRKKAGNVRDNKCCPLGAHLGGGGGGGSYTANTVVLLIVRRGIGASLNRVDSCWNKGREEPLEKLGQPERGESRMDLPANFPY